LHTYLWTYTYWHAHLAKFTYILTHILRAQGGFKAVNTGFTVVSSTS
jgi:hypothetical protein